MNPEGVKVIGVVVLMLGMLAIAAAGVGCSSKRSAPSPAGEAGVAACTSLEGVSESGSPVHTCATTDEIAKAVVDLGPALSQQPADAGGCTLIPATSVCATPRQMGKLVQSILSRRVARYVIEAGIP